MVTENRYHCLITRYIILRVCVLSAYLPYLDQTNRVLIIYTNSRDLVPLR